MNINIKLESIINELNNCIVDISDITSKISIDDDLDFEHIYNRDKNIIRILENIELLKNEVQNLYKINCLAMEKSMRKLRTGNNDLNHDIKKINNT